MAVATAAVGAIGTLAAAKMASNSANKAAKLQDQAGKDALAYTREQDAKREKEYNEAKAVYKQQMEAWQAGRAALLKRYGIDVTPTNQGAMAPGGPQQMPKLGLGGLMRGPSIMSPGQPVGPSQAPPPLVPQGVPSSPAAPEAWNDWSRYAAVR